MVLKVVSKFIKMNKLMALLSVRRLIECRSASTRITADGKEVLKKKNYESRITLIAPDSSVSITDLKNAQNLSVRRDLKLVKVQDVDAKTRRPVYKLMTNAEYHEEELKKRKEKQASRQNNLVKGEKLLTLSSRIGEHDLMTGVKKMLKLLEKQYEVRVVIAGEGEAGETNMERIYSLIESNTKTAGNIVQKRTKGNSLRFQLLPSRDNSSQPEGTSSGQNNNDKGPL